MHALFVMYVFFVCMFFLYACMHKYMYVVCVCVRVLCVCSSPADQRIAFRYIASHFFRGDECKVTIIRNGVVRHEALKLENARSLVPVHLYDKLPSYYVYAGLVFTVLSRPFLHHEYGKQWARKAPIRLCDLVRLWKELCFSMLATLTPIDRLVRTTPRHFMGSKLSSTRKWLSSIKFWWTKSTSDIKRWPILNLFLLMPPKSVT